MKHRYSRREFLSMASATAAATFWISKAMPATADHPVIQSIETFPVMYPMAGRFKFFEGPEGSPTGRGTIVVKLTAEDGTVGWGQSVPIPKWTYETMESVKTTIDRYLTPVLIGRDPFDLDGVHSTMDAAIAPGFTAGAPLTKAGIDFAVHDLCGRLTGQSLPARWGRQPRSNLLLSWTLNPTSLDDVEPLIQQGWDLGYRHFNVKVAPDLKFDLELCRMVKRAVPDGFLWADANGGYRTTSDALEAAPRLADVGVAVLEAPLRPNRISGYQALKQQGALPILMDEGVIRPGDLMEFMKLNMLDGVAMKPARCGGLSSARRQIEILLDAGMMWLGSGLTDPDLSLAATLALYGAYDYSLPAALNGPQFLRGSILKQPITPEAGMLAVPTEPGLGVEVDEASLASMQIELGRI